MLLFKASAKVEASFKDKNVEFKLVCFGTEQDVSQAFVAGEGIGIFETSSDLVEALVDLIAAYYVFDVNYADNMSGMLFFLQDEVLKLKDSAFRGTKYSSFMAQYKKMYIRLAESAC